MAVTNSTPEQEYASAVFLRWFTDTESNIQFSALSGYLPVKTEANNYDVFMGVVDENQIPQDDISKKTLEVAFEAVNRSQMYTSKAFGGGMDARAVLNDFLQNKAVADRATVIESINSGMTHEEAVAQFAMEENFESWYAELDSLLQATAK